MLAELASSKEVLLSLQFDCGYYVTNCFEFCLDFFLGMDCKLELENTSCCWLGCFIMATDMKLEQTLNCGFCKVEEFTSSPGSPRSEYSNYTSHFLRKASSLFTTVHSHQSQDATWLCVVPPSSPSLGLGGHSEVPLQQAVVQAWQNKL